MGLIWTKDGAFHRLGYDSEADLETAILQVQAELFGPNRIYLDVKKKIGTKGGPHNIPDGYLLDLGGRTPRLYVVENELASHDPLRTSRCRYCNSHFHFEMSRERLRRSSSMHWKASRRQKAGVNGTLPSEASAILTISSTIWSLRLHSQPLWSSTNC